MGATVLSFAALTNAADDSGESLYQVIAGVIGSRIRSGAYKPGDALYSIRELAAELGVAKNTIAEMYEELERQGLVVKRRSGHFVTTDRAAIANAAARGLEREVSVFRIRMLARGYTDGEIDAAMAAPRRRKR
jgi:DNA-binding transcriptional regulator YhcF (GntR family)